MTGQARNALQAVSLQWVLGCAELRAPQIWPPPARSRFPGASCRAVVGRVLLRMGETGASLQPGAAFQVRNQQISSSLGAGQSIHHGTTSSRATAGPERCHPRHRSRPWQSPPMDAVNYICCVKKGERFQPRGALTAAARQKIRQILPVFADKI